MTKTHQAVTFTENSLSVTALLAVFAISILTVVSLNPVAVEKTQSNVAGVSTQNTIPVLVQNTYSQAGHVVAINQNSEGNTQIEIIANSLSSGSYSVNLAKIQNTENTQKTLKISTQIEGNGRENLNLFIEKDNQKVLIFRDGKISTNKISINPNEENNLNLRFDLPTKLNFPIKLIITFSS